MFLRARRGKGRIGWLPPVTNWLTNPNATGAICLSLVPSAKLLPAVVQWGGVFNQARPTVTRLLGHHWQPPCRGLITLKAGRAPRVKMKAILDIREDGSNKLWERGTGTQQAIHARSAPPRHAPETQSILCDVVLYNKPIRKWARVRQTYPPLGWACIFFPQTLPATAPDVTVAITGVFLFSLTWAKNLKRSPSSAIA